MSYNGIGLQTARGSGTSGHIQTNLARREVEVKKRKIATKADAQERKELSSSITHHNKARALQIQCMELREELEERGLEDEEIEKRISELRKRLVREGTNEDQPNDTSARNDIEELRTPHSEEHTKGNTKRKELGDSEKRDVKNRSPDIGSNDGESIKQTSRSSSCTKATPPEEKSLNIDEKEKSPSISNIPVYVPRYKRK